MHLPREERVEAWFVVAESDIAVAEAIRERAPHIACFHAQQAAEKALKGLITYLSGGAPPVNAAARLIKAIDELACPVPTDVRHEAEGLDTYYIPTRYPDALGFADASLAYKPRDADLAIEGARIIMAWARQASPATRTE